MTPTAPTGLKHQIMDALGQRFIDTGYFKTVETKNIRLRSSDFPDNQLPAVQIISIGTENTHERTRIKKVWVLQVQVVLKSTQDGFVDQSVLWDVEEMIESQLGDHVQLGITGMVDITIRGDMNDLHIEDPYYTLTIEIAVKYFKVYTGNL